MATGAIVARILTQYSDKGSKQAQKDIQKLGRNIDAFGKKATKAFAAAAVGATVLAVKIGKDAVKAATEEAQAQAVLANNLRNVVGATDATIRSVEEYIDKQEMLSTVSDTELRQSFGALVTASGDVEQAMRMQSVALDVAAGTGKNVQAVTMALVKAQNGQFGALTKLGVPLDANLIKTKNLEGIVAKLSETYAGSAEIVGDTDPLKRLQIAYGRVLETLGAALLPAVQYFAAYLVADVLPAIEKWIKLNEDELQKSFKDTAELLKNFTKDTEKLLTVLIKYEGVVKALSFAFAGVYTSIKLLGGVIAILEILRKLRSMKITYGLSKGTLTSIKEMGKFKTILATINASKFVTALKIIGTGLMTMRIAAIKAAIALAFATGGSSLAAAAIGLAAIGITATALNYAFDKNAESAAKLDASLKTLGKDYGGLPDIAEIKEKSRQDALAAKNAKAKAISDAASAAAKKLQAAADARAAAAEKKKLAIEQKNAALRKSIQDKYNVKITDQDEYENIQLTAVQKLMAKQKNADATLAERIKLRKEELSLTDAINKSTQRYSDLLVVLSDQKLSTEEIAILSKKWGMSIDAVKSYIFTVFAISGEKISDSAVKTLMSAWDMTEAQAKQYLEFLKEVEKGTISDANIKALAKTWYGSDDASAVSQARKYEHFVRKLGDGTLSQKDLEELKTRWNFVTNTEVVEYIKKIGIKVDAAGTILSAGDIAAIGFTNALTALNAFLKALAEGKFTMPGIAATFPTLPPAATGCPTGSTMINGKCTPISTAPKGDDKIVVTPDYSGDDGIARRAAANARAAAEAAAKAAANSTGTQGDALARFKAKEAADLAADIAAKAAQDGAAAAAQANALAGFRAKEAAEEAAAKAAASMDYDERSKFRAMQGAFNSSAYETPTGKFNTPTLDDSKSLMSKLDRMETNVYVTVNGTVTAENDLIQTIRNGLLRGQSSGQTLTLEPI